MAFGDISRSKQIETYNISLASLSTLAHLGACILETASSSIFRSGLFVGMKGQGVNSKGVRSEWKIVEVQSSFVLNFWLA